MSSLPEDNCGLQSCDSAAGNQYGFRLFCSGDFTFCFSSDCRISETGNLRTILICESVQASLITAHAVINVFHISCFCLITELGICKLRTAHDNHIHLIFFQYLLGKFCCIDTSYTNRQHSGFFADTCRIVNIESPRYINWRNFIFCCR